MVHMPHFLLPAFLFLYFKKTINVIKMKEENSQKDRKSSFYTAHSYALIRNGIPLIR